MKHIRTKSDQKAYQMDEFIIDESLINRNDGHKMINHVSLKSEI